MTQYTVMLIQGDTDGTVDSWVYHKSFVTEEEANDLGVSFCKDGEEQLKEMGVNYEYHDTNLFMILDGGYFLMNGYRVFPVEVLDTEGIDYMKEDVLAMAEEAEVELNDNEISWVMDKVLDFDYSDYNNFITDRIKEVVAKRGE